jgi:hypothetical protein
LFDPQQQFTGTHAIYKSENILRRFVASLFQPEILSMLCIFLTGLPGMDVRQKNHHAAETCQEKAADCHNRKAPLHVDEAFYYPVAHVVCGQSRSILKFFP